MLFGSGCAASPSQMGRFETQWLAAPENLSALVDLSSRCIDLVHGRRPPRGIVLDMDSSVSPTHGEQENGVWNGHYACTCYYPLFVFNQFGDLERCALRPGNVHSADGWDAVLKPVVARCKVSRIYFRADAGFANPEVYEFLEAERIKYAIRLPAKRVLQDRIGYLLARPVGRPPNEIRRFHANFSYQAGSWTKPRRVIAKVEWHPFIRARIHRNEHEPHRRARDPILQQTRCVRCKSNRPEDCVRMPSKTDRSGSRKPLGWSGMPVAIHPSHSGFRTIQKIGSIQASSGSSGESRLR
jgi:Transposase DDE domain group 1